MKITLGLLTIAAPTTYSFAPSLPSRRATYLLSTAQSDVDSPPPLAPIETRETTVAAAPKVSQRWRKSTKQLATLGPASSTKEMIETLFLAGADIFRLNFSHGSQEQKKELLMLIREVEEKYSHPIAILGDLQGPKLRVGEFSNPSGEYLEKGQIFRLDLDEAQGDGSRVMLPHPEIIEASEVGHVLLVDDGKVKLVVSDKGPDYLDCTVEVCMFGSLLPFIASSTFQYLMSHYNFIKGTGKD